MLIDKFYFSSAMKVDWTRVASVSLFEIHNFFVGILEKKFLQASLKASIVRKNIANRAQKVEIKFA